MLGFLAASFTLALCIGIGLFLLLTVEHPLGLLGLGVMTLLGAGSALVLTRNWSRKAQEESLESKP